MAAYRQSETETPLLEPTRGHFQAAQVAAHRCGNRRPRRARATRSAGRAYVLWRWPPACR